jgi:hypothetical protein
MRPTRQNQPEDRANEPERVRGLSNKQIYVNLAAQYHLPPFTSRGVNRRYLLGVFTGDHFRVEAGALHHFMADLTPASKQKSTLIYCNKLMDKLNALLRETNRSPMGFEQGMVPEEKWLLEIIRFVDRSNVLGAFLQAVPGAPLLECMSQNMTRAKANAETYLLLGDNNLLANKSLEKAVLGLYDHGKKLEGQRKELLALVQKGQALEREVNRSAASLRDKLHQTALSVFSLGHGQEDADRIFIEGEGPHLRLELNVIREL